jgi:hypothetical protein
MRGDQQGSYCTQNRHESLESGVRGKRARSVRGEADRKGLLAQYLAGGLLYPSTPNSWLTYLSLDAPETKVTYDMGISSTGVIRIAPYGTAPMAVVDGVASRELPMRFPLGTPQVALTLALLLAFGVTIFFIVRAAMNVPARDGK